MWRFLAGVGCALLLVGGGILVWQGIAEQPKAVASAPQAAEAEAAPLPNPPQASEATREEKRFNRYDKDRNGTIAREEYLAARRKAYAKLDTNGDGRLSFDEWAIKATTKFATADADRNSQLNATEFATTRVIRKAAKRPPCVPEAE